MLRRLLLLTLLVVPALSGCVVPENMTELREELGYASVELPDLLVRLRATDLEPRVHETVTLIAAPDGVDADAITYEWSLGDGITATGPTVEHAWTEAGTYRVQVNATGPEGVAASDAVEVEVVPNHPPIPAITVDDREGLVQGTPVVLSAADTTDRDRDGLNHTWTVDGTEAGTGERIELALEAGLHRVELATSDGLATVSTFDRVAVALPLSHESEVAFGDPPAAIGLPVQEGAGQLEVTVTYATLMGLEDVHLALVDPSGNEVAATEAQPTPAQEVQIETLTVAGDRLEPGSYRLEASLERGLSTTVTIEGVLTYTLLPQPST